MGRVSGMEISSSQGLKKPPKLAQGKKLFPPKGRSPTHDSHFGGQKHLTTITFTFFYSSNPTTVNSSPHDLNTMTLIATLHTHIAELVHCSS